MDKEHLLGYLLKALDDREKDEVERALGRDPSLYAELATLQQEIAPLNSIADTVEPPPNLARRTCDKIWTMIDGKKQDCAPNSSIFLNSAFYSPESVLPAGFLLQHSEPNGIEREIPKAKRAEIVEEEEGSVRSTPWLGLIASVSVGIVIAVFLFPMIQYVKRGARSLVTERWVNEINRRVDQYEQVNQGLFPNDEEIQPINLALYGWMGLLPAILAPSPVRQTISGANEVIWEQPSSYVLDMSEWEELIPLDTSSLSDHMLFIIPGRENVVRSAYGQYILFKDDRVFVRELPNVDMQK